MTLQIEVNPDALAAFCQRHHIKKLAFFGSVVRNDFSPHSDVDVLVEFEEGKVPGLTFFKIQEELSEIVGRKVDLNTPNSLSPYYKDQVIDQAEVAYAQPRL